MCVCVNLQKSLCNFLSRIYRLKVGIDSVERLNLVFEWVTRDGDFGTGIWAKSGLDRSIYEILLILE